MCGSDVYGFGFRALGPYTNKSQGYRISDLDFIHGLGSGAGVSSPNPKPWV